MKQRQRKRKFNFTHRVMTFRVTSEMADLMNSMSVSDRATFFRHAIHQFIIAGKSTFRRVSM